MNINLNNNISNAQRTYVMKPWQGVIFGIIMLLIGVGIVWYSFGASASYNEKNRTYIETSAEVIGYHTNTDGLQAIVVKYVVDGQSYEKTSTTYSELPQLVGSNVKIKYNESNPSDMIWVNDSSNIVLPIVGGVFGLVGLVVVITSMKKIKNREV